MNAITETFVSVSYLTNYTDEELVCEYKQFGDYRCFEELVRRYRPSLTRFLKVRYNLHSDQLDDAVQATFARVWQKIDKFDPARSLKPWIYRIASTQTVDLLRDANRRNAVVSLDAPISDDERMNWASEIEGREPEPSADLDQEDSALEVRRALSMLPQVFRQVLELVFFEGLTRQSVAEKLHLTVSTVSRRVTRALEQLKYYLLNGQTGMRSERTVRMIQNFENC